MKKIKYILTDPEKEILFLGMDEGSFYFTEDTNFIEKYQIRKAVVFPDMASAYQFASQMSFMVKDFKYSLKVTPIQMTDDSKYIDVLSLCEQGYGKYVKGMVSCLEPFSNTIH